MGALALRLYCLSSVFAGVGTLLEAYYQSVEREKDAFVLATLRGCAVLLPVTLLLALSWPQGLWWTFPITEVLSLGVFALWRRLRPDRAARSAAAPGSWEAFLRMWRLSARRGGPRPGSAIWWS